MLFERFRFYSLIHCFLFLLGAFSSFGQEKELVIQNKIDSIQRVIKIAKEDEGKVTALVELSRLYCDQKNFVEAKKIVNQSQALAKKKHFKKGIALSQISSGIILREEGKHKEALVQFESALRLTKDLKLKSEESLIYDQIAHAKFSVLDTLGSLNYHKKAYDIRKELDDEIGTAYSSENIATIYSKLSDYSTAYTYFKEAYSIFKKLNVTSRMSLSAGNVGLMKYWLGDRSESLKYFIAAAEYYKADKNDEGLIWMYGLISNLYQSMFEYDKALDYNQKSLEILLKNNDEFHVANVYCVMATNYIEKLEFSKAKELLHKANALYTKLKDDQGELRVKSHLGTWYYRQKEFQNAIHYFTEALAIKSDRVRAICERSLGIIYLEMNDGVEAKKWLTKALDFYSKTESTGNLPIVYLKLAQTDSLLGDFKSAYINYQNYIRYEVDQKFSLLDAEKLALKYEFDKKEAIAKAELRSKRLERNVAYVGLSVLLVIIIIIVALFRLRSKKIKVDKENILLQQREIETAKEHEQFKSRFLTNITHEFRTPLTLIKGHLEVLKETAAAKDIPRLSDMELNGKRLLQLINQLLELSKLEDGAYKLKYQSRNIEQELTVLTQSFHSMAERKGISYQLTKSSSFQNPINQNNFIYSSEALSSIVTNLLSNAFKFAPEGGKVAVYVDLTDDCLTLEVEDNGIGLEPEHLEKIFNRFYQVDNASQRTYEGSGIGLALVKELAIIHGGDVQVKSEYQKGCRFIVTLKSGELQQEEKAVLDEKVEVIAYAKEVESIVQMEQSTDKLVVLVVEDHTELRRFIVENLSDDYTYLEAKDGLQGLKLATEYVPDLIISDNMMPDMNGLQMTKALKGEIATSHIPIIMLTAKVEEKDRLEGLIAGVDEYLTKPFSLEELKLRVRNILNTRTSLQEAFRTEAPIEQHQVKEDTSIASNEINEKHREFLGKLKNEVLDNLTNKDFGVTSLCEIAFLSQSQFARKLKSMTGKTPIDFIRTIRLECALEYLQDGESVSEVGYKVGFDDPVYFSKVFKKHFGFAPSHHNKDS